MADYLFLGGLFLRRPAPLVGSMVSTLTARTLPLLGRLKDLGRRESQAAKLRPCTLLSPTVGVLDTSGLLVIPGFFSAGLIICVINHEHLVCGRWSVNRRPSWWIDSRILPG